jgi:ABC-type spermidine/putrescine transport system permease subunit I
MTQDVLSQADDRPPLQFRPVQRRFRFSQALAGYLLVAPPFLVMLLLIIYPALLAAVDTFFVTENGVRRFTLDRYIEFFQTPLAVTNLIFTLEVTVVTVIILFAVCFPISLYLRFSAGRVTSIVQILSLFPMFVPGIITAYALIRFMGANGWLERFLEVLFNYEGYVSPYLRPSGIVIGLVWEGIPLTVLILTAGLSQISDEMIETARDVGANSFQVFWRIIVPLLTRPLLIVLTLNFLGAFGAFTIPYLLGPASPEMMGVYMRRTFYDANLPSRAQVQAVITFAISALVSILYVRSVVSQKIEEGV